MRHVAVGSRLDRGQWNLRRAAELSDQRGEVGAAGRDEQVAGQEGEAADGQVAEQGE